MKNVTVKADESRTESARRQTVEVRHETDFRLVQTVSRESRENRSKGGWSRPSGKVTVILFRPVGSTGNLLLLARHIAA